ncbi:hypothetical protein CYMTET_48559 [Cymbomonas tetramitiformis]|uniref:Major facilitator superfamily (MFS) profile domain-containing protein n=1 Tax=Cymbomonas tetramitiformis TaxID=36881 RepID=A0AAE0BTP1_9CHLO|nr:hypothetical protein CYMTET_48559 [Cymbomonas tetramitiformis]
MANTAPNVAKEVCHTSDYLATFTVGMVLAGAALVSPFTAYFISALGRRKAFIYAGIFNLVSSGVTGITAIFYENIYALFACCFLVGAQQGIAQFYRFSVVEVCGSYPKSVVISIVISGGMAAGLIGPQGSRGTVELAHPDYSATMYMMAGLSLVNLFAISLVAFPDKRPAVEEPEATKPKRKSLASLLSQPDIALAIIIATLAHSAMLTLMSTVTLAIQDSDVDSGPAYTFDASSNVLTCHYLGMFAPGLFSGFIIQRIGPYFSTLFGTVLFGGATAVLWTSTELWSFYVGMTAVGIAWNFCFSSATVLLTQSYKPEDAMVLQGANDLILFGVAGICSFSAGFIYAKIGWLVVVMFAIGVCGAELVILGAFRYIRNRKQSALEEALLADSEQP